MAGGQLDKIGQNVAEKKISRGGDKRSEEYRKSLAQSEQVVPKTTAEKIAEEHNISPRTVVRSADLFRSHLTLIATSKPISLLQDEYIPWPA